MLSAASFSSKDSSGGIKEGTIMGILHQIQELTTKRAKIVHLGLSAINDATVELLTRQI